MRPFAPCGLRCRDRRAIRYKNANVQRAKKGGIAVLRLAWPKFDLDLHIGRQASEPRVFAASIIDNHARHMPSYLHHPPTQPSNGPAPLLILLHGYGSNERDLIGLAPYLDHRLHVVSVRAPISMGPEAYAWFPLHWSETGELSFDEATGLQAADDIAIVIPQITQSVGADPARVFLGGFSQGAMMTLAVLLRTSVPLAGAILMSGAPLPALLHTQPGRALPPVIITHGLYDEVVPPAAGQAMRDLLSRLEAPVTFHSYPMAHSISDQALDDIDNWLTARLEQLA
jgi:phospholipase/carboxylesterase